MMFPACSSMVLASLSTESSLYNVLIDQQMTKEEFLNQCMRKKMQIMLPLMYADVRHHEQSPEFNWDTAFKNAVKQLGGNLPDVLFNDLIALARVDLEPILDESFLQNHLQNLINYINKNSLSSENGFFPFFSNNFRYDCFCFLREIGRLSTTGASLMHILYQMSHQKIPWMSNELRAAIWGQEYVMDSEYDSAESLSGKPTTLLHLAVVSDQPSVLDELIIRFPGALNLEDMGGNTLFSLAVMCGNFTIFKKLVALEVDVTKNDKKLVSLFEKAIQIGHKAIVETMVDKYPAVYRRGITSHDPLYLACKNGHTELVALLLAKGFPLNPLISYTFYGSGRLIEYHFELSLKFRVAQSLGRLFDAGLCVTHRLGYPNDVDEIRKLNDIIKLSRIYPEEYNFIHKGNQVLQDVSIENTRKLLFEEKQKNPRENQMPTLYDLLLDALDIGYLSLPLTYGMHGGTSYIDASTYDARDWQRFEEEIEARSQMPVTSENPVYQTWLQTLEKNQECLNAKKRGRQGYNRHKTGRISFQDRILDRWTLYQSEKKCTLLQDKIRQLEAQNAELLTEGASRMPVCSSSDTNSETSAVRFTRSLQFFQQKSQPVSLQPREQNLRGCP